MSEIPTFEKIVSAHGHTCPGIALGYKIAVEAAKWSGDETEISVESHTVRCPLDALKTTFNLREHPERLTVINENVSNFTLTKPDGSRLIITEVPGSKIKSPEADALRVKIDAGTASDDEIKLYDEIRAEQLQKTLDTPNEKLFTVKSC